ncbi:hypothetical protein, partial [Escherichia coli]|uniref:hypothetical protein n=1 Tax=Escherichia coli TaxID=562 RepID=UPI0020BF1304
PKTRLPTDFGDFIDTAIRHVLLKQGVIGIKVQIMLPWDPTGQNGPKIPQPDVVKISEPKDDEYSSTQPYVAPSQPGAAQQQAGS